MLTEAECGVCAGRDITLFCTAFDRFRRRRESVWRIMRCRGCGFGWTSPPLKETEIAGHYPAAYLGDTARMLEDFFSGNLARSRAWKGETEKIRLVESCVRGGRILDVGCGDGKFLWALDSNRWNRTGVEFSGATLALVRPRMPDLQLVEGDLHSKELRCEYFDAITFWHVFEHLPNSTETLRRARALLRPGGWLFISLPRLDSLQAMLFRQYWYPFDDVPRHLYHFSRKSLEMLLRNAGFHLRRVVFFSRRVNFHSLKHSLLNWSRERIRSSLPYYLLKPLLFCFPLVEQFTDSYGILTAIAQKPSQGRESARDPRA
jgi:SAM-dependent methyltransferase